MAMDATGYKNLGNEAFSAKKFDEAIEHFTSAIELDPKNHVLFSNRSASYLSLNKFEEAKADAEKCVALNAGWAKGYTRLGAALHGLKEFDKAIETYKKGQELDPSNTSFAESIQLVQKDQRASMPNPFAKVFGPDCLVKISQNPQLAPFLKQPDYVQIISTLMQNPSMIQGFMQDKRIMQTFLALSGINLPAGAGDDDDAPVRKPAANPSSQQSHAPPADAKPTAQPAATKPAASPSTKALQHKEAGNALYKERKFDEALAEYKKAIELEPENTLYLLNCTAVSFEKGEYEPCIAECISAIEHGQTHKCDYTIIAKLLTRQALCLQRLQRHEEAIPVFKKALLEHRNPDTLKKLEECEKEKKLLDEKAYINPEIAAQKKDEGNAFFKQDKFPEAVAAYTEAIKRNPAEHTVLSNRAAAYLKLGAYDDALKDAEKCLSICPTFVKAHARKGHAYFWTKQYNRALQAYEEGLRLEPTNQDCLDGLQRTKGKIGEVASGQDVEGGEEAARRAMSDPEIASIMQDSYMQLVLGEMQKDPSRIQDYLRDPGIAAKLNKLIAAGILRFGGPAPQQAAGKGGRR
jgi:stress-induced-phosphoprotein 1